MVEEGGKPVIVVAVDDSSHSNYALEWTLDYFCAPFAPNYPFKLMLIHARPSLIPFAGPGSPDTVSLAVQEVERKKKAQKVTDKAIEICSKRSVNDVAVQVMDGDPRNVMTEAVDKFHPAILVLGSHGYGAIKRAVLGSVSDYCAHHCSCTVMIVKKPKSKH